CDAHAWVEVNTVPGGWQQRYATPSQGLRDLQDSRHSLLSRRGRLADSLQNIWDTTSVAFDQTTQEKIYGQPSAERKRLERAGAGGEVVGLLFRARFGGRGRAEVEAGRARLAKLWREDVSQSR